MFVSSIFLFSVNNGLEKKNHIVQEIYLSIYPLPIKKQVRNFKDEKKRITQKLWILRPLLISLYKNKDVNMFGMKWNDPYRQ